MLLTETRYDRQERISWWDQSRLHAGRVLVVGAGAIGNELVKNLVLTGVGHIDVVDMDAIEYSNLSRGVFFREGDEGRLKADIVVSRASELNADVSLRAITGTVQSMGTGSLAEYDLVLGGLDNHEARLWVNGTCRRLGIPFIDAAIEGLHGVVRTFYGEGACYECTLTDVDWQILSHRRSCALLGVQDILAGKTPTNATTASLVAAVQVQEAIKFLVGRTDLLALVGRQWTLLGEQMVSYISIIDENPDCMAHDEYAPRSGDVVAPATLQDALHAATSDTWIDFTDDFIVVRDCPTCGTGGTAGLRAVLPDGTGTCVTCESVLPSDAYTSVAATDAIMVMSFARLAWPTCEIISVRSDTDTYTLRIWSEDGQ